MSLFYPSIKILTSPTRSIKVGNLSHTSAQLLANLQAALPSIVKHVPGGWDNMQSFHLKTSASVALPIWSCKLEDAPGGRWEKLVADAAVLEHEETGSAEEKDNVLTPVSEKKGKKRTAAAAEEGSAKPAKKAKSSTAAALTDPAPVPLPKEKKAAVTATALEPTATTTKVTKTKTITSTPGSSSAKVVKHTVVETTEPPSGKKGKKTKIVETLTVSDPAPPPPPAKPSSAKGKGKAADVTVSSEVGTPHAVAKAVKSNRALKSKTTPLEAPTTPPKSNPKSASTVPPSPAPTSAELKAKKAGLAGEKKKVKALSKRPKDGRTTAKAGLLGRKK